MSTYSAFDKISKAVKEQTTASLKGLQLQLNDDMPQKSAGNTLIFGTRNIRNSDDSRFGNGPRTQDDLIYIAEIISRFVVLAVHKICTDPESLNQVVQILGRDYDYILTDVIGNGNDERHGFIFNTSKVSFGRNAGEFALPLNLEIASKGERLFARTPFMCSFQSGSFDFSGSIILINHTISSSDRAFNKIMKLGKEFAPRAKRANHILVGDFSVVRKNQEYNILAQSGFEVFKNNIREWRAFHCSNHFPLWVELEIGFGSR